MNPYKEWIRYNSIDEMEQLFDMDRPVVGGLDTETTGLHIKKDKPFLIIFGWLFPNRQTGRVFSFYPTISNLKILLRIMKKLHWIVIWNATYDLHMLRNIGFCYDFVNILEGVALARLTKESLSGQDKESSLKLKDVGITHVSRQAGDSEKLVKAELRRINSERQKLLTVALKQFPLPVELGGGFYKNGKPKTWTKKAVEDFLKDPTHDVEDLPEEIREVFIEWKKACPPATYYDVYLENPEVMTRYAQDDVITMLEFYRMAVPVLKSLGQVKTLKRENQLIYPLLRMERNGIKVNREYLETSRKKLKAEIKRKRERLAEIAGERLTPGQHQRIIQIYKTKWNITLPSADKKQMKDVIRRYKGAPKEMAETIQSLRRLEKWYSTYCLRILEASEYDGRYYTQFNQCGAVSGRFSSDAQQFPKERILTDEGYAYEKEHGEWTAPEEYELFYPRKAFVPTDAGMESGYTSIWYCDYSQIELRNQADYTLHVCGGDLNLCRAYMPFKCYDKDGNEYDYKDPVKRKEWKTKEWFDENGNPWVKTDVHSETTHNSLVILGYVCEEKYKSYYAPEDMPVENRWVGDKVDEKAFKMARYKGKIFNFMANYGGGLRAAIDQLDLPENIAKALIAGYKQAFPGVKIYQQKVEMKFRKCGGVRNRYGRLYFLDPENARFSYRLSNHLIQGTCADMLKDCIIKIDRLLQEKMAKSRMLLTVHDELQFEIWKGEEWLIPLILQIMEDQEWHWVPIVCDAEVTYTNWAEKKAVDVA